ncbi:Uncharacterised protein [Amycolatopsis camponoti]|uniref:Class F sortase n=1 Tax=Amycolatopsis camponoti TaxID=2606593 RepID=A0A6I8M2T9_9PSEU|nr:class F sortase [Amycolatopsis camponoti]VVJ21846.1 Uncharacterised protein [Amycolatopsis camponoti]
MSGPAHGGASRFAGAHRHLGATFVAAGVVLAVAGTVASTSQPQREVVALATTAPPSVTPETTAPPTSAAELPTPTRVINPTVLKLPEIGVTATVLPAGVDETGAFDAPRDVGAVGWYRYGPGLDANTGSLVIGGHVDSAESGPGAFFQLHRVRPGSSLQLIGDDGKTRTYVVTAREQIPKEDIDLRTYFDTEGSPRVTLFTCGGTFDRKTRNYLDNIVVTAIPR